MILETWKEIPGFDNYSISSHGRVLNNRFVRYLKPFGNKSGSKSVNLYQNGMPVRRFVRELVLETFIGEMPPNHRIAYLDGNRSNEHLSNLVYLDENERICSSCNRIKNVAEFHDTEGGVLGKSSRCKDCKSEFFQDYYHKNKDAISAKRDEWARNKKDKRRASGQKRRALVNGGGGSFTDDEWLTLCSKFDNRCLVCGSKGNLTTDHVVPVVLGGSSDIANIQPLCVSCNSSKGIKIIDYRKATQS